MSCRPGSRPAAASPLPGRVACKDSSDSGRSPPTTSGSIEAPVTGLLRGLPSSCAEASTVAGDGCGGIGMTIRLLSGAGAAVVVTGTGTGAGATVGCAGAEDVVMSAASAGATKASATNAAAARSTDRRSAMIDHLEELVLLIDPHRGGVPDLVAEPVQDVVDALRRRIDGDIDAGLRRAARHRRLVADRVAETAHGAVERAVPLHRDD